MVCSLCRQVIPPEVHPYTLRLELFPAIEPTLEISEADLRRDFEAELNRLIQIMESMDENQVLRQEDLMFFSHSFTLCLACRDRLADQLRRLAPPPEAS